MLIFQGVVFQSYLLRRFGLLKVGFFSGPRPKPHVWYLEALGTRDIYTFRKPTSFCFVAPFNFVHLPPVQTAGQYHLGDLSPLLSVTLRISRAQKSSAFRIGKYIHFIHSFIHAFIDSFIHACMHACMHSFMHACMHACMHSFMHSSFHYFFISSFLSFFLHSIHSFILSFLAHVISCHFISFINLSPIVNPPSPLNIGLC